MLRLDAGAGVDDGEHHRRSEAVAEQRHVASLRRELHRVVEQVDEDLLQRPAVGIRPQPLRHVRRKDDSPFGSGVAEQLQHGFAQRGQLDGSDLRLPFTGFQPREIEQVVRQPRQPHRVPGDHADELARLVGQLHAPLEQRLRRRPDGRHRRPQLVRRVGDEVPADPVGPAFGREIAQHQQRPRVRQRRHVRLDLEVERGQRQLAPLWPPGQTAGTDVLQLGASCRFQHGGAPAQEVRHCRVPRHHSPADFQQRRRAGHRLQHLLQPGWLATAGHDRLVAPPELLDHLAGQRPRAELGANPVHGLRERQLAAEERHYFSAGSDMR